MDWSVIGKISTGISLLAFIAALIATTYRTTLNSRISTLKALPPKDRLAAATQTLNTFGISSANLTSDNAHEIALRELSIKEGKYKLLAAMVVAVALIFGIVTVYAIYEAGRSRPDLSGLELNQTVPPLSPRDASLSAAIIGTWKSHGKLPEGTGWYVKDLHYSFAPNSWVEWQGSFVFANASYPILMSGTWRIQDGKLLWLVKQSNVANVVPAGHRGATPIVKITDNELHFLDPNNDGKLTVDTKVQ